MRLLPLSGWQLSQRLILAMVDLTWLEMVTDYRLFFQKLTQLFKKPAARTFL